MENLKCKEIFYDALSKQSSNWFFNPNYTGEGEQAVALNMGVA